MRKFIIGLILFLVLPMVNAVGVWNNLSYMQLNITKIEFPGCEDIDVSMINQPSNSEYLLIQYDDIGNRNVNQSVTRRLYDDLNVGLYTIGVFGGYSLNYSFKVYELLYLNGSNSGETDSFTVLSDANAGFYIGGCQPQCLYSPICIDSSCFDYIGQSSYDSFDILTARTNSSNSSLNDFFALEKSIQPFRITEDWTADVCSDSSLGTPFPYNSDSTTYNMNYSFNETVYEGQYDSDIQPDLFSSCSVGSVPTNKPVDLCEGNVSFENPSDTDYLITEIFEANHTANNIFRENSMSIENILIPAFRVESAILDNRYDTFLNLITESFDDTLVSGLSNQNKDLDRVDGFDETTYSNYFTPYVYIDIYNRTENFTLVLNKTYGSGAFTVYESCPHVSVSYEEIDNQTIIYFDTSEYVNGSGISDLTSYGYDSVKEKMNIEYKNADGCEIGTLFEPELIDPNDFNINTLGSNIVLHPGYSEIFLRVIGIYNGSYDDFNLYKFDSINSPQELRYKANFIEFDFDGSYYDVKPVINQSQEEVFMNFYSDRHVPENCTVLEENGNIDNTEPSEFFNFCEIDGRKVSCSVDNLPVDPPGLDTDSYTFYFACKDTQFNGTGFSPVYATSHGIEYNIENNLPYFKDVRIEPKVITDSEDVTLIVDFFDEEFDEDDLPQFIRVGCTTRINGNLDKGISFYPNSSPAYYQLDPEAPENANFSVECRLYDYNTPYGESRILADTAESNTINVLDIEPIPDDDTYFNPRIFDIYIPPVFSGDEAIGYCAGESFYDTISYRYEWLVNDEIVDIGSTELVSSNVFVNVANLSAGNFSRFDNVSLTCQIIDTSGLSNITNETVQVQNGLPQLISTDPINGSTIAYENYNFTVNATDPDNDTLTYHFLLNDVLIHSGNQSFYDYTGLTDKTEYNWTIKIDDGFENATYHVPFYVSLSSPAINILSPREDWFTTDRSSIDVLFFTIDPNGTDYCELWVDDGSGFALNNTLNPINDSQLYNFTITGTQDQTQYLYNIFCQDENGIGDFYFKNMTTGIDTIPPEIFVFSPANGTYNREDIPVTIDTTETFPDLCAYEIYYAFADILREKGTIPCDYADVLNVTYYRGGYRLDLFSQDIAGNRDTQSVLFYSIPESEDFDDETPSSGGGGGGGAVESPLDIESFLVQPTFDEVRMSVGSDRFIEFSITNTYVEPINVVVEITDSQLSDYMSLGDQDETRVERLSFELSDETGIGRNQRFIQIYLDLPDDIADGVYNGTVEITSRGESVTYVLEVTVGENIIVVLIDFFNIEIIGPIRVWMIPIGGGAGYGIFAFLRRRRRRR